MITIENIKTEYKKLKQADLPDVLKQDEYDFVIENLDLYNEDETIKEYIDTFIKKLNEFAGKSKKVEKPKAGKPQPAKKTADKKKSVPDKKEISKELKYLLEHAVEVKKIRFSTKAFRDLLRNVKTPIGKLSMSKKEINYQLKKFTETKKRINLFSYLQPTLENPVYIVKDDDDYVFIKSFVTGDKPFIVVVRQSKMITATLKSTNNIDRLFKRGQIAFPDDLSGITSAKMPNRQFTLIEIALPFQIAKVTKEPESKKCETSKIVESYNEDIRLIRRFHAAIGKERQRRSVLNIYRDIERRAIERKIRKNSPYAEVLSEIQTRLKKAIDYLDKNKIAYIKLEPKPDSKEFYDKVAAIAQSTGLRTSANLLKRFVGIEGEIKPEKAKVERLHQSFENALKKGKICDTDLYYKEIIEAKKEMESYLKGASEKIKLSPQTLNGLESLGLGKYNAGNGLNGIVADFNKALKQFFANSYQGKYLKLGKPKSILRSLGLPNNEIIIRSSTLKEKIKKHKLTYNELKNMPNQINSPLLVFKYDKGEKKHLNVFVSRANNEGLLVCGINLVHSTIKQVEVNEIRTIHGRRCSQIIDAVNKGELLYNAGTDKIKKLLSDSGINCPKSEQLLKVLDANLSNNKENNKKNTEKFSGIEVTDTDKNKKLLSDSGFNCPQSEQLLKVLDANLSNKTENNKKNLSGIENMPEPVEYNRIDVELPKPEKKEPEPPAKQQNKKISPLFSRITDNYDTGIKKIQLPGDLGRFLGYVERYEYAILLRGDKGAGKTRLLYQLMNTFALAGFSVASFSLEIGKSSNLVRDMRNTYIYPTIADNIFIADQTPNGIKDIEEAAQNFDVVCIDSWSKIPNAKADDFDKLRKKYPETMFIVIFQSTTNGTARGGSMPEYDAGIVIQVNNGGRAVCEKNRYNGENLTYLVFEQRLEQTEMQITN